MRDVWVLVLITRKRSLLLLFVDRPQAMCDGWWMCRCHLIEKCQHAAAAARIREYGKRYCLALTCLLTVFWEALVPISESQYLDAACQCQIQAASSQVVTAILFPALCMSRITVPVPEGDQVA